MLEVKVVDKTPTAEMKNAALTWMKSKLPARGGQVVFAGIWQEAWKQDFPPGESPKTRAVLALYEDATVDSYTLLDHAGVYCEVTLEPPAAARRRAFGARFSDIVVGNDEHQTYLWCLKSGRAG